MSSNRQPEENENLLSHIASTVKVILDRMATKDDLEPFATKDDLKPFATKDDLKPFATKDDLEPFATKKDLEPFATKKDLEPFATKKDLEPFATRKDLERLVTKEEFEPVRQQVGHLTEQVAFLGGQVENVRDRMATKEELAEGLGKLEAKLSHKIEVGITAVRGDIERVHLRLDAIEKALSSRINHIEAEMSRMRSVLYLLVKDKPEMLRLLGQSPPAADEREKSTP